MTIDEKQSVMDQENTSGRVSFEDVLGRLGMPGRFQLTQLTFTILAMQIMAFMSMSFIFYGYTPEHKCNGVNESELLSRYGLMNDSLAQVEYQSCDISVLTNQNGSIDVVGTISCPNRRNFSDKKYTTWMTEWDLVCESQGIAEWSYTVYNIGLMLGGLCGSFVADRYGRKPVFITAAFFCFFTEALLIAMPNIYAIIGYRFINGLARQSFAEIYIVIGMELLQPHHRYIYGLATCIGWNLTVLVTGLCGYLLQNVDWRYYQGCVVASGILFLVYPFIMKESTRWLVANNRFDEALVILQDGCKRNGSSIEQMKITFNQYVSDHKKVKKDEQSENLTDENVGKVDDPLKTTVDVPEKGSILVLLQHRELLFLTLAAGFILFANNMTYFGLFMTSSTLTGDRFVNYTIMVLVEIPGNLLGIKMMEKWSRLFCLKIFLFLSALTLFVSTMLVEFGDGSATVGMVNTVVVMFGKFAVSTSYSFIYICVPEFYPTNIRSVGAAACISMSRAGSMIAPFLRPLYDVIKWGPGVLFTLVCFVALALTTILPEMKDKELPTSIEELKTNFRAKRRANTKNSIL